MLLTGGAVRTAGGHLPLLSLGGSAQTVNVGGLGCAGRTQDQDA